MYQKKKCAEEAADRGMTIIFAKVGPEPVIIFALLKYFFLKKQYMAILDLVFCNPIYLFMKKLFTVTGLILTALLLFSFDLVAQSITISGTVADDRSGQPLAGVNLVVKGKVIGTTTDTKGNFSLTTNTAPPFTLVVSAVGYGSKEVEVTGNQTGMSIALTEQVIMADEVVVAASRVEESVLQSPVSVEKMDIRGIRETPSASFYEGLANLKGVDMSTQSLTFRSISTRGFNANGNLRMVQMIDGMDNQAPGLNFSVGNIAGISELDLESVELLPGAASALYGPNAVNGILLMTSKSPFRYQGLSASSKLGVMHVDNRFRPASPMYEGAIRYAKAFNNKIAFKVNASYLGAQDWQARDQRDQSLLNGFGLANGNRDNNPGYNGVNVYGDELNVNIFSSLLANGQPGTGANGTSPFLGLIATTQIPQAGNRTLPQLTGLTPQQILAQMIPNQSVSRTGYEERDLVDYDTKSLKLNGALHYRLTEKLEGILQANYGYGTTVYTGQDRYSIRNFSLSQFKAELRGSNFFVRAYTTQERSGDSYAGGVLGQLVNESWKPSQQWFPQYFGAYAQGAFQNYAAAYLTNFAQTQNNAQAIAAAQGAASGNASTLHTNARNFADQGRLMPGTPEFEQATNAARENPIPRGARFLDKTNLYHAEFMYNFTELAEIADITVGGNVRQYDLNSEGTLFARDSDNEEFNINEFGAYVQASRKLFDDALKLTGSLRYDKNENFKGLLNPRISGVYTLGEHNFRASYQTGFRIPTTQNQYIDLLTPQARLLGGLPLFRDRYNLVSNPVYTVASVQAFGASAQAGAPNPGLLQVHQFRDFQPEQVQTYEVGYKSLIGNKLFIDAYYYFTNFNNYIGTQIVIQNSVPNGNPANLFSSLTRNTYGFPINRAEKIQSQGWALGVNYALPSNYTIGGNLAYNALVNTGDLEGFQTEFNTPRYRANVTFANREVVKNLGFSVAWRWQEAFLWQSTFVNNPAATSEVSIIPAYQTFDAQMSYKISPLKTILKIGGSNIFNNYYRQAWGNPSVGGLYYIQLTFDEFLN